MFYTYHMRSPTRPASRPHTLTVRIGSWFEAQASGWGVLAVAAILVLVLAAGALGLRLPGA